LSKKEPVEPVYLPADLKFELKREHHRLEQELIKLQEKGIRAKRIRVTEGMVIKVATCIGIEKLRTLTYLEFEKLYLELFKK